MYISENFKLICAKLGIKLTYSTPYHPQGKGKIEVFWKYVQSSFVSEVKQNKVLNIMELNDMFQGWLKTDAYAEYEKVEGITRCLCFSHLRRYYLEAIPLDSRKKEIPGSGGAIGRAYCDKLFRLERKWK